MLPLGRRSKKEMGNSAEKYQKMFEIYSNGCFLRNPVIHSAESHHPAEKKVGLGMGRMNEMTDYKKMYTVLCGAVDEVIDPLEQIPMARASVQVLREALLRAERIYIDTTTYTQVSKHPQVVELRSDDSAEPCSGV